MKGYIKWLNGLPRFLKVIFAIPCIHIFWDLYRIFKAISSKNVLQLVLAIVLLFVGFAVAILDIITLILSNRVIWFD